MKQFPVSVEFAIGFVKSVVVGIPVRVEAVGAVLQGVDPVLVKFSMDLMAVWARVSASHEPALVKEVVVGKDMVGL